MLKVNHRRWMILLLLCALALVASIAFGMNSVPVAHAQDDTPEPDATPASTPDAETTAEDTTEPEAEVTPTPEPTEIDIRAALQDLTAEEVARILLWVVVIVLGVVYGSRLLYALLRRLTKRTETTLDDVLLDSVRPQISWLMAAIGFQIATMRLEFVSGFLQDLLETTYFVLYWLVVMATFWRLIDRAVQWHIESLGPDIDPDLRDQKLPLVTRLLHMGLGLVGIAVLLAYFGVNLVAVMGALGLGGFAISLAAKESVTNIISGIVIMFDAPFKVGDRIHVPAVDTWADVVNIGISSCKVVTRDNRLVVIPNSAVVEAEVINYSQPDPSYRLQVDLGIGYNRNIPWVTKVLEDAVRGVEGVLQDKPVNVLFTGFGDDGMTFRVRWWVASPGDKRSVTHRVCSAIQEITDEQGIEMPDKTYALVSTIKISDEDAARLSEAFGGPQDAGALPSAVGGEDEGTKE
jgi:MscS family membrane protein